MGATTPAQLQASLPEGAIGSGFTSRVVFVFEEDKERIVIKPELTTYQERLGEDLLVDLGDIRNLHGEFQPTDDFEELYTKWRIESEDSVAFKDYRLEYYMQRRPTHLFKISMIFAASRGSEGDVTAQDLQRAIEALEEAEEKMPLVFSGVGTNPLAGPQMRILRMLRMRREIGLAELSEAMANDLSHTQLSEVMNSLVMSNQAILDVSNKKLLYKDE
jgi:hypothetical protein